MPDLSWSQNNRAQFSELVSLPDEDLALARACLTIAAGEYPNLNIDHHLSQLAQICHTAVERTGNPDADCDRLESLNDYLFGELKFHGNVREYFDPQNSYLNRVLERKTGIPITLSVIYLEVGWHLGWPLTGVGFPGHFLVKYACDEGMIVVDPFGGGAILDEEDCRLKLADLYGEGVLLRQEHFESVSKKQILSRVLTNLKNIYLNNSCHQKALNVVEMLLILNPETYTELRERGFLNRNLECYSAAKRDLESYLERCPDSRDAKEVAEQLSEIRRLIN